jgi:septal ring factor EnvC (AmiA/AmiB activator)
VSHRRPFPPRRQPEAAYDVNGGGIVRKKHLGVALVAILVVALIGGVTGQQQPKPFRAATLDDVLEELRAFRSELRDSSATSLRAQLLLARLQVQEQRVATIWRQLSEVEGKLQVTEKGGPAPEHLLKLMGVEPGTDPPAQLAPVIEMFNAQMAAAERANTDLKQRQVELAQLMTNEQSRWTTLNAEIEALEKALAAVRPQRE